MKNFYITRIEMKLFEATQKWMKIIHLA